MIEVSTGILFLTTILGVIIVVGAVASVIAATSFKGMESFVKSATKYTLKEHERYKEIVESLRADVIHTNYMIRRYYESDKTNADANNALISMFEDAANLELTQEQVSARIKEKLATIRGYK